MEDIFSAFMGLLGVVFVLALFIGFVILIVFLVKKGQEQNQTERRNALETKLAVQELVNTLPQNKQAAFMIEYNSRRKDSTTAVLLAIFLGAFGAHKFYLGDSTIGVLYLLFCWTYIPGILGIIDAFSIGKKVELMNARVANEVAILLGAMSEKGGKLPINF